MTDPLSTAVTAQMGAEPITVNRPTAEPPEAAPVQRRWNLAQRVLFRFGFVYFVLYFLPFPLSLVPRLGMVAGLAPEWQVMKPVAWISKQSGQLVGWHGEATTWLSKWVGSNILSLQEGAIVVQRTGSGDTMLRYVQALTLVMIAAVAAAAWSGLDFRRRAYPRLASLWHVYVRYALATVLLGYGLAKVPPMQFPMPGPERLIHTYGQSSPMGLLWTFMGASPAYTMFAGAMEILPALLLLWRRTATLGALMSAAVMLNVVMLNFCYDVPVKLFSSHLLLASVLLALPQLRRLIDVLVLQRDAAPVMLRAPWRHGWQKWSARALKAGVLVLLLGTGALGAYQGWKQRFAGPKPELYGLYEVVSFSLDGQDRPPLTTDALRWRRFIVTQWGMVVIQTMTDGREYYPMTRDKEAGTVALRLGGNNGFATFTCEQVDDVTMILEGPFRGGRVRTMLRKTPDDGFPLMSRGFHWIQEMPHNR